MTPARPTRMDPQVHAARLQAVASGLTLREAAVMLGLPVRSLESWAYRAGVRFARPPHHRIDPSCDAQRMAALDEGLTLSQAAIRLGVAESTLESWATRRGLRFARSGAPRPRLSAQDHAVRLEALNAGLTLAQAARQLGVARAQLYRWAYARGLRWAPQDAGLRYRFAKPGMPALARAGRAICARLSAQERADWDLLAQSGIRLRDRVLAIRRPDLLALLPDAAQVPA